MAYFLPLELVRQVIKNCKPQDKILINVYFILTL